MVVLSQSSYRVSRALVPGQSTPAVQALGMPIAVCVLLFCIPVHVSCDARRTCCCRVCTVFLVETADGAGGGGECSAVQATGLPRMGSAPWPHHAISASQRRGRAALAASRTAAPGGTGGAERSHCHGLERPCAGVKSLMQVISLLNVHKIKNFENI